MYNWFLLLLPRQKDDATSYSHPLQTLFDHRSSHSIVIGDMWSSARWNCIGEIPKTSPLNMYIFCEASRGEITMELRVLGIKLIVVSLGFLPSSLGSNLIAENFLAYKVSVISGDQFAQEPANSDNTWRVEYWTGSMSQGIGLLWASWRKTGGARRWRKSIQDRQWPRVFAEEHCSWVHERVTTRRNGPHVIGLFLQRVEVFENLFPSVERNQKVALQQRVCSKMCFQDASKFKIQFEWAESEWFGFTHWDSYEVRHWLVGWWLMHWKTNTSNICSGCDRWLQQISSIGIREMLAIISAFPCIALLGEHHKVSLLSRNR